MTLGKAICTITISLLLCGLMGGEIGWMLGTFAPSYYSTMFPELAASPDFNLQQLGVGLGLTQGLGVGALIGCVLTIIAAWMSSRGAGAAR